MAGFDSLTEGQSRGVVVAAGAVLFLLMVKLRFCYSISLPPKPPQPEAPAITSADAPDVVPPRPEAYQEFLVADSRRYKVPRATPEQMGAVLPYTIDDNPITLYPSAERNTVELAGLRLSVSRRDSSSGKLLALSIGNLGEHDVAFRVVTRPTRGDAACRRKVALVHNAMALSAGSTVVRSECRHVPGAGVRILSAETIALPPLGYFYISALKPESVGLDSRTTSGHVTTDRSPPCSPPVSASLRYSMDRGETTWRDMIDFYARHRCSKYRFAPGYKSFQEDGERPLPVVQAL